MNTPTPSTFSQIISSPTLWGLFIALVLTILKIADPAFISTDTYASIIGLLTLFCGYFHIPVLFTANSAAPVAPTNTPN